MHKHEETPDPAAYAKQEEFWDRHERSPVYRLASEIGLMFGIRDLRRFGEIPPEFKFLDKCSRRYELDDGWRDYETILLKAIELYDQFRLTKPLPDGPPPTPEVGLAEILRWCLEVERIPCKLKPTIIRASVAADKYHVTRKTIRMKVKHGLLNDYRPKGHASNSPLLVDENEVKRQREAK